ncbi:Protein MNN4 [Candida viswanathii]|uniref:Protein MNN4 n=1 Tax=Candida viswanathii TaxID=5486 RepID=A0A367XM41_9ASCO|nr:Protein MNN4 [Candida viswanathii]
MSFVNYMPSSKRSLKLVKFVIIVIAVFNLLYFTLVSNSATSSINKLLFEPQDEQQPAQQSQAPMPEPAPEVPEVPDKEEAEVVVLDYSNIEKSPEEVRFNEQLGQKFNQIKSDPRKYFMVNTELTEPKLKVNIKNFLKKYEDADSWINKNELFYDPRFTLAVYLNELKLKYKELSKASNDKKNVLVGNKINSNEVPAISLPFNWADWMDLTVLNNQLGKPIDQRIKCLDISKDSHNSPDVSYFCRNNEDILDVEWEDFFKAGFRNKTQFPGFIIHSHEDYDHYCSNDYRVLQAKSYAMTSLLNPLKVIILSADESTGGTFEFNVDSNTRLASSKMVDRFVESQGYSLKEPRSIFTSKAANPVPDSIVLDHLSIWQELNDQVLPQYLSSKDFGYNNSLAMRKKSIVTLGEEKFKYPGSIKSQIDDLKQQKSLNRHEQMYLDGLEECSKYDNTNEIRYFKMATINPSDPHNKEREWGWHYDWRYFSGALNYEKPGWNQQEMTHRTNIILDRLLRNWQRFSIEKGIITWIMHGPLLSWYWNGLLFPFDNDIDIQMPIDELLNLAKNYNQTLVVENPSEGYGKYLIEVNSYIHNRGVSDQQNHIDARFIDVDSGIYIDITALSNSSAKPPKEYEEKKELVDLGEDKLIFNDRRKHFYTLDQIGPLKFSMLTGIPVLVPHQIANRLKFEYSKGLSAYEYGGWFFIKKLNLWVHKSDLEPIVDKPENGEITKEHILKQFESYDKVLLLLESNQELLQEYYLTKSLTHFHDFQKSVLFDDQGLDKPLNIEQYNRYKKEFKMIKPLRKALFDYEKIERVKHHTN